MGKSRRKSHSRSHRKTMKRSRTTKKHYKGGASAWQYVGNEVGNGWTQFKNSLIVQPGENSASSQSNNIVPVNNVNAENAQPYLLPGLNKMTGGKRRHKKRGKKGGSLTAMLSKAAVPFGLLGLQQYYKPKTRKR